MPYVLLGNASQQEVCLYWDKSLLMFFSLVDMFYLIKEIFISHLTNLNDKSLTKINTKKFHSLLFPLVNSSPLLDIDID